MEQKRVTETLAEPWFGVEEISEHLNVSKETIYRWLERGQIPAHRIGKLWRFKASTVDAWVETGGADPKKSLTLETSRNNGE